MLRGMDYEIKEENLEKMTYYGKANYEMSRANTTEWIEWLPTTMIAKQNTAMLSSNSWGFNDGKETNPFKYYRANESVEPAEYFAKIYKYYKKRYIITCVLIVTTLLFIYLKNNYNICVVFNGCKQY